MPGLGVRAADDVRIQREELEIGFPSLLVTVGTVLFQQRLHLDLEGVLAAKRQWHHY